MEFANILRNRIPTTMGRRLKRYAIDPQRPFHKYWKHVGLAKKKSRRKTKSFGRKFNEEIVSELYSKIITERQWYCRQRALNSTGIPPYRDGEMSPRKLLVFFGSVFCCQPAPSIFISFLLRWICHSARWNVDQLMCFVLGGGTRCFGDSLMSDWINLETTYKQTKVQGL